MKNISEGNTEIEIAIAGEIEWKGKLLNLIH